VPDDQHEAQDKLMPKSRMSDLMAAWRSIVILVSDTSLKEKSDPQ